MTLFRVTDESGFYRASGVWHVFGTLIFNAFAAGKLIACVQVVIDAGRKQRAGWTSRQSG